MKRLAPLVVLAACGGGTSTPGPHVMMDATRATSFYDMPFPSDDLRGADGHVDLSGFPNTGHSGTVDNVRALAEELDGFSESGGIFFRLSTAIDPAQLPDHTSSTAASSPVYLVSLDASAPDHGTRYPVDVTFQADGGPYGAPDLLALIPQQGVPLAPHTRYAAVVTTALVDAAGTHFVAAPADVLGDTPAALGVDPATIAGLTVFTTEDPGAQMTAARAALPATPPTPTTPTLTDTFGDFCVYHATVEMPDYQHGTPPFDTEGGDWVFANGALQQQSTENADVFLTIPRTAVPAGGFPFVVFSRTGAGGDRPLVDRGQQAVHGGPAIEPGEGPARYFARAGFAAIQVDGPLGGLRNTTGRDEQFLIFNINNLTAMRDNVRESALELDLVRRIGAAVQFAATDCLSPAGDPGPASVTFDGSRVAIMGHSMGAWIAPLTASANPAFGAMVLSGAGGSWIENVLYKTQPVRPEPVIAVLVQESTLHADDPILTLAQWALEPSDPQVYDRAITGTHVLMEQGIVDDYILPRIANSTSLPMGLDLAGPELDTESDPRLAEQEPIGPLLPLVGRSAITLPASGNGAGGATRVVIQHLEDGIEDGHEVVFQTDAPKHQYQCFLASWLTGTPSVPPDDTRDAPCP